MARSSSHCYAIIIYIHIHYSQGMLDYDHVCSRDTPSVAAMVYPFRYSRPDSLTDCLID